MNRKSKPKKAAPLPTPPLSKPPLIALGADEWATAGQEGDRTQGVIAPAKVDADRFSTGGGTADSGGTWKADAILLGRFRLRGVLGRGGMGEVWEALDAETSEVVALKRLHPSLFSNAAAQERFLREIRGLQKLRHPAIVRVYDFFPEGMFFSMERLLGQTLRATLSEKKRLPLQDTLRLLLQLTEALQATHQQGIIHRDLKPENLFLCAPPPWSLKLLDFGILLLTEGTRVTETRVAGIGTAYYMAPEQLEGHTALTVAVDVYACGVLLYEMLTGRIFQGHAPSLHKRYHALAAEGSLTPSEWPPETQADLLQRLESLDHDLRKAAAYEPTERLSLAAFQGALQTHQTQILQRRKDAADRRWQEAERSLASTPADLVLSGQVAACLLHYPEREDIDRWGQGLRKLWEAICDLAERLKTEPPLDIEERQKHWQKGLEALRKTGPISASFGADLPFVVAKNHVVDRELRTWEASITLLLSESAALCERQGLQAALEHWKARCSPSPPQNGLWDCIAKGVPSSRLRQRYQRMHDEAGQIEAAVKRLKSLPPSAQLETLRQRWQEAVAVTLAPKTYDAHPFTQELRAEESRLQKALEESRRLADAEGPAVAFQRWSWTGRASTQIEPWLKRLQQATQDAGEAAEWLQGYLSSEPLENVLRIWNDEQRKSSMPSAFQHHPFGQRLRQLQRNTKDAISRLNNVAKESGPSAALELTLHLEVRSLAFEEVRKQFKEDAAILQTVVKQAREAVGCNNLRKRHELLNAAHAAWHKRIESRSLPDSRRSAYADWLAAEQRCLEKAVEEEGKRLGTLEEKTNECLAQNGYAAALSFWKENESILPSSMFQTTLQELEEDSRTYESLLADTKDFLQRKRGKRFAAYEVLEERWQRWQRYYLRPFSLRRPEVYERLQEAKPRKPWPPALHAVVLPIPHKF